MLLREDFTPERIDAIIAEARKHGPYDALTHEERAQSRYNFLQAANIPKEGLWVFGYGSLLWNPAFHYIKSEPARLFGYRRHFCLRLTMGRGSIDKPGIMLALDTGGSCNGRAFLIEPDAIDSETRILWMREMLSGAYVPHWGRFKFQDRTVPGLTFIVNKQHSRYVPQMPQSETLECLAQGEGYLGSCREYLENTISHLDEIRVKDAYLHRLQSLLQASHPAAHKK